MNKMYTKRGPVLYIIEDNTKYIVEGLCGRSESKVAEMIEELGMKLSPNSFIGPSPDCLRLKDMFVVRRR